MLGEDLRCNRSVCLIPALYQAQKGRTCPEFLQYRKGREHLNMKKLYNENEGKLESEGKPEDKIDTEDEGKSDGKEKPEVKKKPEHEGKLQDQGQPDAEGKQEKQSKSQCEGKVRIEDKPEPQAKPTASC
ncbi:unnamed protein product [Pipistrellus nathusii]|uniref:Uncharacterized protein n=1 Tax=Pipistrellus nathusii TaxID=59473 RepID=A0ABP0AIN2_PIPNA